MTLKTRVLKTTVLKTTVLKTTTRRQVAGRAAGDERGGASLWVLAVVGVLGVLLIVGLSLASLLQVRQRAAATADLASLAAAAARVDDRDACGSAARVVLAHGGTLVGCTLGEDDSVQVGVLLPWRPRVPWWPESSVVARARAGPAP